jgi:hypothetical protein
MNEVSMQKYFTTGTPKRRRKPEKLGSDEMNV